MVRCVVAVACRRKVLEGLHFEFDGERAEWMRWFLELQVSSDDTMLGTGRGADFYLYNWYRSFPALLQIHEDRDIVCDAAIAYMQTISSLPVSLHAAQYCASVLTARAVMSKCRVPKMLPCKIG